MSPQRIALSLDPVRFVSAVESLSKIEPLLFSILSIGIPAIVPDKAKSRKPLLS